MCTEVNSAMGLQATTATKRKHEITFDSKNTNTYTTNCPPPIKAGKWSMNNNNYIEAVEEQLSGNRLTAIHNLNHNKTLDDPTKSLANNNNHIHHNNNNNNINNNNESKSCPKLCGSIINNSNSSSSVHHSINHGKEVTKAADSVAAASTVNSLVTSMIPMAAEMAATTPLPPTSTTPVPEDSIAKLEVVAAVPCEPWTSTPEPLDCISKLQAVAVPSDPWGSISTRSTLATTLLSADELDDDDDDFEDDYEEEESIIPTYCPLRYHPFPTASATPHQPQRLATYSPTPHGYGTRPNYYSEPFPQQNCSRTGSPQHMRIGNGFPQWQGGVNNGPQQFYVPPEAAYPPQPPQQQQTIRCAENGKSYLELGCSSPAPIPNTTTTVVTPTPFGNMHMAVPNLDGRHHMKRCCDGRGTWCNTNKNCYKDIRLKIRNLSMFKLSRFRQVSEQSLYRSVLICNTLKRIDREIEAEAKEMHQAAAHAAQAQQLHHQHTQYHQLQQPLHLQHHPHHNHHHSPQQHLPPQQPQALLHQQHQEYAPVMNCVRLASMDYQVQHQHQPHQPPQHLQQQHQQQQQQQQQQVQQQQQHFQQQQQHTPLYQQSQPERLDTPPPYLSVPPQMQKSAAVFTLPNNSNCDSTSPAATPLHPYDHYPFRESHSGRATPFPTCQPVISTPTASVSPTPPPPTPMSSAPPAPAATPVITPPSASSLEHDSGYVDDDSTRSINWSSVLSLSSQSALDPLSSNDLFSILPPATSVTNPATAVPVPAASTSTQNDGCSRQATAVAISGTFTTVQTSATTATASSHGANSSGSSTSAAATSPTSPNASTTATFTTLSTISSATHSLTSSYVSSMSSNTLSSPTSTWEYGFLDMEFGLGSEFTELVPSCKLSSDELFKSALTPVATSRYSSVHDNELEQPAHIMVGS